MVQVASIQLALLAHDPDHRATCEKKGANKQCRFRFPFLPCRSGTHPVIPSWPHEDRPFEGLPQVSLQWLRSGVSAYINKTSLAMSSLFRSNTDVTVAVTPVSAYYVTSYNVKEHDEESSQAFEIVRACERGQKRAMKLDTSVEIAEDTDLVNSHTSSLSLVMRAWRGSTRASMVSAQEAAHYLRWPSISLLRIIRLSTAQYGGTDGAR
jgi:hypothetical protein